MKLHRLRLAIFILTFGLLATSAQANFFGFHRGDYNWGDRDWGDRDWGNNNNEGENEYDHRGFEKVWNYLCGGEDREWNFGHEGEHERYGDLIEKFKEICGDSPEVNNWIELLKGKCDFERPEHHRPRPPRSAVPEPSTYGIMGACALLGLVAFRRFKIKQ
ncbi:MAG: PEP-CTERM sorting domain-containing protein [Verrucomicrobia bacterium]|nr:PEP-CTERM sorting domain-containing protein [Verrucomicrobiota bacterium]